MKFTVSINEARGVTLISAGNPAPDWFGSLTKKMGVSGAIAVPFATGVDFALGRAFVDCLAAATFICPQKL